MLHVVNYANSAPDRPPVRAASLYGLARRDMMSSVLFGNVFFPPNLPDINRHMRGRDERGLPLFLYLTVLCQLFDPRSPQTTKSPVVNRLAFLHPGSQWWAYLQQFTVAWRVNNNAWRGLLGELKEQEWIRTQPALWARVTKLSRFIAGSRPSCVWFEEVERFLWSSWRLTSPGIALHVARELFIEWLFGLGKRAHGHQPLFCYMLDYLYSINLSQYVCPCIAASPGHRSAAPTSVTPPGDDVTPHRRPRLVTRCSTTVCA